MEFLLASSLLRVSNLHHDLVFSFLRTASLVLEFLTREKIIIVMVSSCTVCLAAVGVSSVRATAYGRTLAVPPLSPRVSSGSSFSGLLFCILFSYRVHAWFLNFSIVLVFIVVYRVPCGGWSRVCPRYCRRRQCRQTLSEIREASLRKQAWVSVVPDVQVLV